MKVLYVDCFSGISGDMMLGALLDLGIDQDLFRNELKKLHLAGYEIVIEKKVKSGITVTDVEVIVDSEYQEHAHRLMQHSHHCHENKETHHSEEHSHGRNLLDILTLIDTSHLNENVKDFSKRVFKEIARAEGKVHNKKMEEVHFHEVGAVDSIVDIVGVSICLDLLGVSRVFSSPLHDGKGFIKCQHGMIPVPVPAVMEMLKDSHIPFITEDINTELVTPTGMGIIKSLAVRYGDMPSIFVEKVGYGAGKRETGRFNALRIVMGDLFSQARVEEEISILETNIDNMNSEILGFSMEKLLENGALDVFYTPIYMKKNRPAVMLTVLCKKEQEKALEEIILSETSTIGIRKSISKRTVMDRVIERVDTEYGEVQVKVSSIGEIKKLSPEYEDLREIAKKTGVPLWKIYQSINKRAEYLL